MLYAILFDVVLAQALDIAVQVQDIFSPGSLDLETWDNSI